MRMPVAGRLLVLVSAISGGVALRAQALPAPTGPSRPSGDGTLNDESLHQMLVGMGYEPGKLSKGFLLTLKRESWTYYVQLVLSPDGTKLGLNANLGVVPQPEAIPAATWRKLLEDNIDVDPSSFNFDPKLKKVFLHRVLDNRSLTASTLRIQIDRFCDNIHDTADDWKFVH